MAVKMKPPFGVQVMRGHPLARGLIGVWLLNEPRGVGACDIARRHNFAFAGTPTRIATTCSGGLRFDGSDDYLTASLPSELNVDRPVSLVCRARQLGGDMDGLIHIAGASGTTYRILTVLFDLANSRIRVSHTSNSSYGRYSAALTTIDWHQYVITASARNVRPMVYVDGELHQAETGPADSSWGANVVTVGAGYNYLPANMANAEVDYLYLYNRVLGAGEVRRLWQNPFGFVGRAAGGWGGILSLGVLEGVTREASGTIAAVSDAGATAAATPAGEVPRGKPWHQVGLQCGRGEWCFARGAGQRCFAPAWWREALFDATTDGAWKLGTVLTQGWFWSRRNGCSVAYRECTDPKCCTCGAVEEFGDAGYCASTAGTADEGLSAPIACVAELGATSIVVPAIWPHEPGSSCRYVVRRFNGCGEADRTAAAAVAVHIDAGGELAQPAPNAVAGLHVEEPAAQIRNCLTLAWLYWPVAPAAPAAAFKVYWDHGTGQIDFVTPLAVVPCDGRKHYACRCGPLEDGWYRFAVRPGAVTQPGGQAPCGPDAFAQAEVRTVTPSGITIYDL